MIKTHTKTNVKYLCKTTRNDPHKYKGSGKYWKRHIAKYGNYITTEILIQTDDLIQFKEACKYYSEKYDVVNNKNWANLIEETGLDGGTTHNDPHWLKGFKHSDKTKEKISENMKKSISTRKNDGLYKNSHWKGKKHSDKSKEKMSKSAKNKRKSDQHRKNISKSKSGIKVNLSEEVRNEKSILMKKSSSVIYKCSICEKTGNAGNIGKHHKKCMENKNWKKIPIDQ